jgi:tetratricopeptide (TPR) repeat protein
LFLLICTGLLLPCLARAAKPGKPGQSPEDQLLTAAQALFDDQQFNLAEARLGSFLAAYTNSPNRPYAILLFARSRYGQSNYDGAIQLLTNALPQAGALKGQYVFWAANARLQKGEYELGAAGFAEFIRGFSDDPRLLEAVYDQALAYSKMENWAKVAELLQKPDGAFARLSAADPKNRFVTLGLLLLGQASLEQGKYGDGEKLVSGISPAGLDAETQWRRLDLLCRLELGGGRFEAALQNSTNLLDTMPGARHQAAGRYLRGEIFEAMGRTPEALESYTNNLSADLPAEYQRKALLKIVALNLALNQAQDAVDLLTNYVAQRTNGAALDLARVSLGELYLKLYYNPPALEKNSDVAATASDFLQYAQTNFEQVIRDFPTSPLLANAHLDRGWCYWAQTNMPLAQADFQMAADHLPRSPDQAVARFKLADSEFYQTNYGAALINYTILLHDYSDVESVTNELFDHALYQIVKANLARNDQAAALAALQKILEWYPNSLFADRGQLLFGESRRYDYAMARRVFNELLQRSPKSPLLPDVEYAVARTYEQEGNWREAVRQYEGWLVKYATNAPLLVPQVEYSRALAYGKAGMETNALNLFTNFVARYASNSILAPWAQNWVADYYFNQGDYQLAEGNYLSLYQTFPAAGLLSYEARLMAGRAALAGQRPGDARSHFTNLVAMTNAPLDLQAEGWFALGDAIMQQFRENPTNATFFNEAITAFSKLTNGPLAGALAPQAYGRLGDCYRQWADLQWDPKHDPSVYNDARLMYQAVTNLPPDNIDVSTRSQVEVALGQIAERQGQPDVALEHYSNVLYELAPSQFDPFWVEQAGKAAGRIYEQQQQWAKAIKVYQRVQKAVPSLRAQLEKAILDAQAAADKSRN